MKFFQNLEIFIVFQRKPAVEHDGVSASICMLSPWAYVAWIVSITVAQ